LQGGTTASFFRVSSWRERVLEIFRFLQYFGKQILMTKKVS
jgi:hypothetical protein